MFENLELLRAYALTCKTAIYNEDAMTAIELAGCTAKKVNEVVDVVNKMIDIIDELAGLHDVEYDEATESLVLRA